MTHDRPVLTLGGVTIVDDDIDSLSTACGLSLNLIAYLFRTFALAETVTSSGTLLIDPSSVLRMASCCATRERILAGEQLPELARANVVLIPVHDEIIAQAPTQDADEFAHAVANAMSGEFGPVPIVAEADVIGSSWGDAYRPQESHASH